MTKTCCSKGHELTSESVDKLGRCRQFSILFANAYKERHPERVKATQKRYNKLRTRTLLDRHRRLLVEAKRREILISLTLSEYTYLVSFPCFYCGGSLPEVGTGIDRINSDIGYVQGNVRPCCTACNLAKNAMTESEFKEWSLRLYNHWSSK